MGSNSKPGGKATRDGFGQAIVELGSDEKIVVLDADLSNSTRSEWFEKKYPERFFNVGIAEQNMIGIAAGLAISGKTAFACSFAGFLVNRAHDHIRISVCYNNANVKLIGTHAGIQIGEDGPTNQSMTDISTLRALPNMVVIQPADAVEAKKAVKAAAKMEGPCYIRLTRNAVPTVTDENTDFEIGKGTILREGKDVVLVGSGATVSICLEAAKILSEEGIDAGVLNIHTIKPIDTELIQSISGMIVTVEDHSIYGGLGSAVAEVTAEKGTKVIRIGLDRFAESGKPEELYEKYGLTAKNVVETVKKGLK